MINTNSGRLLSWLKKESVSYLFFGVLTTIVNYTIFVVGLSLTNEKKVLLVNMIAFVGATLFAYVTNKIFVFRSMEWKMQQIISELGKFVGARVFSLCVEQVGLYISSEFLHLQRFSIISINGLVIVKVVLSFVSVLLNYFASKFIVFKKERVNESTDDCSSLQ